MTDIETKICEMCRLLISLLEKPDGEWHVHANRASGQPNICVVSLTYIVRENGRNKVREGTFGVHRPEFVRSLEEDNSNTLMERINFTIAYGMKVVKRREASANV
jgi:hypothetical protein